MTASHSEIERKTREYGGQWAMGHARRIVALVERIAEGRAYNAEIVWAAAHLHDWGGYAKWIVPGRDHAERSVEVVEPFLTEIGVPDATKRAILECVKYHHAGGAGRSVESVLFTDADALDLLGVVGFARIFGMWHRDLEGGRKAVIKWREQSVPVIETPKAREIAAARAAETEEMLGRLEEETGGDY
jgi:uncharacterized protein